MEKQSDFMSNLTLGYGVFLLVWGIVAGLISTSDSLTRFIPCFPGLGLMVSGWLAQSKPEQRKLWMHVAVVFGLITAILGTRFFMVMSEGIGLASGSMLKLLLTGSAYTGLCVRSFIEARKARLGEASSS
jgi:hypothetical protein